jgi:hypothetical protein
VSVKTDVARLVAVHRRDVKDGIAHICLSRIQGAVIIVEIDIESHPSSSPDRARKTQLEGAYRHRARNLEKRTNTQLQPYTKPQANIEQLPEYQQV